MIRHVMLAGAALALLIALTAVGCDNSLYHVSSGDPGHYRFPDGGLLDGTIDASVVPDACVPSVEVCDGLDNDCNGVVDDVAPDLVAEDVHNCGVCGNLCDVANAFPVCVEGSCAVGACFPGYWDLNQDPSDGCEYSCSVTNNGLEVCDGIDNDCDGQIDEDFDLQNNPLHCGQCFRACNFFQAEGSCVEGLCALSSCRPGFADADQNPNNGCECQLDVTEGTTACDPAVISSCGTGEVCVDNDLDGVHHCAVIPLDGCDGRDNDCDGEVDEDAAEVFGGSQCYGHPLGCEEVSPGVYSCQGQCQAGAMSCFGGQALCSGDVGPSAEICDGVDNNCDGVVDEGYDLQWDSNHCGACNYACALHMGANSVAMGCVSGVCQYVCRLGYVDLNGDVSLGDQGNGCEYPCTITAGGVEVCGDGIDNDCDGEVDEGFDLQNDPQHCGACNYVCSSNTPVGAEVTGCVGGFCQYACLPGLWDADNDLALGRAGNGCEYACTLTNGGVEICDDLDNDCDGQIDEDFAKATNPDHCGACNYRCADHLGANSEVLGCGVGICQYGCLSGWVDVNGDVSLGSAGNGCEYACTISNGGVEICDGLDNDCDGLIDEAPGGGAYTEPCYSADPSTINVGICREGTRTCTDGLMGACVGEVVPGLELCDGLDNDCDGVVDNGIDTSSDLNNCGDCGVSCWADVGANAYPHACELGVCKFTCMPGYNDLNGDLELRSAGNGCEYPCPVYPPVEEYCDGLDNDCDGLVDEGLSAPLGICYQGVDGPGPALPGTDENNPCKGVEAACMDPDGAGPMSHGWYCAYPASVELNPLHPNMLLGYEERCDGKDGDCDGVPDDNFSVGRLCDDGGLGACRGTGTFQCTSDQLSSECVITTPGEEPSDEICDGKDNDCDGLTDESQWENVPGNEPPGITKGYVEDDLVTVVLPSGVSVFVYRYEASHPTATFTDGGMGTEARSCSRPDVIPWSYVTFLQAQEACNRAGMRLCRPGEWYEACHGTPTAHIYPYGDTYDPQACNGHDMDPAVDAVEPTGTQIGCVTLGYGLEDMSGNLREWTDDLVGYTSDNRRVFRLRGGSYRDLSTGLRCNFTSSAYVEDSMAPHIGFRCCTTCGNGTLDPMEGCDPGIDPTDCHPVRCGPMNCGDGNLDPGEACDDGNYVAWDGCSPICTSEVIVFNQTFGVCPAAGWVIQNGGYSNTWFCESRGGFNNIGAPSVAPVMQVSSTSLGVADDGLVTPAYNLSGYAGALLDFYHRYYDSAPSPGDHGAVQYSLNGQGGPWTTITTFTSSSSLTNNYVLLDVTFLVARQPNVAFRFQYNHGATGGDFWQVDNIRLRAY